METEIDKQILSLFPSLDYNRAHTPSKTRGRMKVLLEVLAKASKDHVTKYSLEKDGLSSQSAMDVLRELESLRLLKTKTVLNEKRTIKKEHTITAKGVIACMAIPDFQKAEKLKALLENTDLKGNKLASLLRVYNQGYVLGANVNNKSEMNPAVAVVKALAVQGFNLEGKTEENIAENLQTIEEKERMEQIKISPSELIVVFLNILSDEQRCRKLKMLMDAHKSRSHPQNTEEMRESVSMIDGFVRTFTSPEVLSWLNREKIDETTVDAIIEEVDKKMRESNKEFKAESEKITHELKIFRDLTLKKAKG